MTPQATSALITIAIYVALIGFVLYRQMTAQPLNGRRLVILPAVLGLFALQQLSHQQLAASGSAVAILVIGVAVGVAAGVWRGSTFRIWTLNGTAMVQGTWLTLVAWAVLILVRLPLAYYGHLVNEPQGLVVGELLLALAVTFAAQNVALWSRANAVAPAPVQPAR